MTFINIKRFTSNKQRNALLISCYPENNVKPNRLMKLTGENYFELHCNSSQKEFDRNKQDLEVAN